MLIFPKSRARGMWARSWEAWLYVVLFVSAQAGAQETTLSARVKVVAAGEKAESSHAENVVVWLSPIGAQTATKPFPSHPLRLTQHNKSFEPPAGGPGWGGGPVSQPRSVFSQCVLSV